MSTVRPALRPGPLALAGIALLAAAAIGVSAHVYDAHHHSMFQRYDTSFGQRCLASTAWSTTASATQHGSGGASVDRATATGLPRLTVFGNDGSGQHVQPLTFTAPSAVGSDQLRPADATTSQVLHEHNCPS